MISAENLKIEFNAVPLFSEVSYVINKKDRIALVGKNGAGKSTMLKIIAGLQTPSEGRISMPKSCKVGYLPQVMLLADGRSVREEAEQAFEGIRQMQADVEKLNAELAERTDYESAAYQELIEQTTVLQERLQIFWCGDSVDAQSGVFPLASRSVLFNSPSAVGVP